MTVTRPSAPAAAPREAAAAARPGSGRVVGLDGLRALAVAAVVTFHLAPGTVVGGYIGVDVFFVVSGFLITRLLLRERGRTGRVRLGAFWLRRARRLLPALVLVLLACSTAALLVGGDPLVGLGGQLLAALTFSSNWYFILTDSDYFADAAPELFRNLWSLGVEEQFYLLWPLVLVLVVLRLARPGRIAVLAGLTLASAGAMALLFDPADPTRAYYGTGTHAFGLTLGALLAVAAQWWSPRALEWRRGTRRTADVLGWAAIAGLALIAATMPGDGALAYRGGLLAVAVLTAVVIIAFLAPDSTLGRALEARPLTWLGARSYGIYLWHWPIIVLLAAAFPGADAGTAAARMAVAVVLTLAAAALSYRFVEQPIRTDGFRASARAWRAAFTGSRGVAVGAAASVILLVVGVAGTAAAVVTAPQLSETEQRIEVGRRAVDASPVPDIDPAPSPEPTPDTVPVQLDGAHITAIGDSVMLAAAPELQAAFPGIAIDAGVSRQLSAAPPILRSLRDSGALRDVVVIGLGTNGSISAATLDEIRGIIGRDRQLVVVSAQAPRGWIPEVNARLASFAWQHRDVELADWYTAAQPHLDELSGDQVHFGGAGARRYTSVVEAALTRLSQLPPLRDDASDESLPRPV